MTLLVRVYFLGWIFLFPACFATAALQSTAPAAATCASLPLGTGAMARAYAALPPPEFVAASDGEYTNKILVTWSAVSNASGYEIWRQTTNDCDSAECLAVTAGTAYEDAAAAEVTLYLYWITATNNLCRSAPSLYDTGFRQLPAPPHLKVSDNTYTDRVQIAWGVMSNALSYEVWRGVKDSCETAEKLALVESNVWRDVTAMPGVLYYYWVRAVPEVGLGDFSKPGKGRRKCLLAQLRPPASVKASDGDFADKVFISWSVASNACGYEVWRNESTNAPAVIGISLTNFYEDKTALTGVVYGYKLRSTNAFAISAFSRVDKGFVGEPKIPPAPPTGVTASQGTPAASVRIQWTLSPDAKRYEIWRGASAQVAAASPIGNAPARATVFNDASALPGTRYTYWLRSISGVMTGKFSAASSGFRPLPPPARPVASRGTFNDKVRLQWTAVTNAGLYEIWRSPSNTFASAIRVSSAASTAFDDATAQPGIRYFYWVRALNAACPGMPSAAAIGFRPLPAPRDVSASDGSFPDRVQVSWKAVPDAMRYEVWRGLTNSTAGARRVGFCSTPVFADRSAAPGTRYYYFVRASSATGLGPFSESNAGHRMPKPPNRAIAAGGVAALAVPATFNATDGAFADKVRLTWKAVPGAAAYEILRGLADHPNRALSIGRAKALAFDDVTAEPGKEYNYWVRGINDSGAGALSAGTQGHRQLPAPINVRAAESGNGISLAWNGVAQASQYEIWRNTTAHSASAVLLAKTARTLFEDADVTPGIVYTYWVRSCNGAILSPYSTPLSASRQPAAPRGFEASKGVFKDRVRLTWQASEGATGYELWRAPSPDIAAAALLALPVDAAYDDMTALPGVVFVYWVRARDVNGVSGFSACDAGYVAAKPTRIAVPADYDGDGVSDLALFHPETGEWFVQSMSGELLACGVDWGGAGLLALQGDYDGDGACDFAAYDPESGAWYISSLEGNVIVFGEIWGGPGWAPVAGDYDGDGIADMAVYESATGLWNIRSVTGRVLLSGFTWGGDGFVPVAAPASLP